MPSLEFWLAPLDVTVTASSATLSGSAAGSFSADATAEIDILVSDAQTAFQFQTDSVDITDVVNTDIKYKVVHTSSSEPFGVDIDTRALVTVNQIHSSATNNNVTYDFVRYLGLKLFNTHFGVDLFSNEESLRNTLNSNFKTSLDTVLLSLAAEGELDSSENSPSEIILDKIILSEPDRLKDITPYLVSNNWFKSPLRAGDILYFKLYVNAAANQETLTNVSAIPQRSYLIKATLVEAPPVPETPVPETPF